MHASAFELFPCSDIDAELIEQLAVLDNHIYHTARRYPDAITITALHKETVIGFATLFSPVPGIRILQHLKLGNKAAPEVMTDLINYIILSFPEQIYGCVSASEAAFYCQHGGKIIINHDGNTVLLCYPKWIIRTTV